ncbi:MAG TPA: ATP-binding protein [Syntrophales bacterium]|nr:ATP-binding protein [Syntrophales bacterium]
MKATILKYEAAYRSSLQECLTGAGEVALQHGYELGRQAVRDGLGVMDIISVHREVTLSLLSQAATTNKCVQIAKASQDLLAECLAPFEFTHRGFIELESLNLKLEAVNKDLEREIADRRRAEEALRESETTYHNLFNNITEEVHFWELVRNDNGEITNWRLVDANPPALTTWGKTLDEIKGKTTDEIFGAGASEHYMGVVSKIMLEGVPHTFEDYFPHLDKHFLFTSIPLGDYFITTGVDISNIKKAQGLAEQRQVQLEEANKELEAFAYSVSHDLRAPLRAIDGYARMILKKEGDRFDEDTTRKFNDIRSNANMMGKLIDDILTLSRLGRAKMSIVSLEMDGIIKDVWKELQIINPERKMNLNIQAMPPGYGDRTLIKQVYANLLGNAVKFTKYKNPAEIEAGGYVIGNENIYYVKDDGVGFDMTYCDKLFGIFQRLHNNPDFEGTGVGLATVQRAVHRLGGRVWAEGKIDEGATFYFSLPYK